MLTVKQEKFALAYVETSNASEAYRRAYDVSKMSETSVNRAAHTVLTNDKVSARIAELRAELAAAASVTIAKVVKELADIAFADPNDIVRHVTCCCRHCHGVDHEFQWISEREWAIVTASNIEKQKEPPSAVGGFGFDPKAPPHPACPSCGGLGTPTVTIADTDKLKGPARRLYAGVKQTKNGIEVKLRDQDKALEMLGRHLGAFNDKLKVEISKAPPLSAFYDETEPGTP